MPPYVLQNNRYNKAPSIIASMHAASGNHSLSIVYTAILSLQVEVIAFRLPYNLPILAAVPRQDLLL